MGLLDSVLGAVAAAKGPGGALGQGAQPDLMSAVIGMLANGSEQGGLGGLVAKFQQAGLGEVVNSWISTGQNLPVSPEQLGQVLGQDKLAGLAQQLGLPQGDLMGQLSQMLPQVVDQLTPTGQAPQGGLGSVADLLGMLMKR